ncbi:endonuclease III domain-containing protein [Candidatus Sumerlaeota bacterium]|nr:endonuclease III domain-containing protein [Candidatus Sumerlaeota bacterium]
MPESKRQKNKKLSSLLMRVYTTLLDYFGAQGWWPGESREEIIIGAVLTQNTNWANVEKAIDNLRAHRLLSLKKIATIDEPTLARLIRPAGYFNIKARRLKATAEFFVRNKNLKNPPRNHRFMLNLRDELLQVYGIGKETADSILLYALMYPVFVVDAYTRRFCFRHRLIESTRVDYEDIRLLFEDNLPRDVELFNEFHALLVRLGKTFCRPKALCEECPLNRRVFFLSKPIA